MPTSSIGKAQRQRLGGKGVVGDGWTDCVSSVC